MIEHNYLLVISIVVDGSLSLSLSLSLHTHTYIHTAFLQVFEKLNLTFYISPNS